MFWVKLLVEGLKSTMADKTMKNKANDRRKWQKLRKMVKQWKRIQKLWKKRESTKNYEKGHKNGMK